MLPAGESLKTFLDVYRPGAVRFNRIDRRQVYTGASIKVPKRIEDQEFFAPRMALKQDAKRNLVAR